MNKKTAQLAKRMKKLQAHQFCESKALTKHFSIDNVIVEAPSSNFQVSSQISLLTNGIANS